MGLTVKEREMRGLLPLSTLEYLTLHNCEISKEAFSLIRSSSWPCLREISIDKENSTRMLASVRREELNAGMNDFSDDPVGVLKAVLHLTALETLHLNECKLSGEATSLI